MVADLRADEFTPFPELPPAAKIAWRRFRRGLARNADERGIEVPAVIWNGIRNAWRDGYWTGRDAT
jgi:hypothetical protein